MYGPGAPHYEYPTRSWQQRALRKDSVWGTVDRATADNLRRVVDGADDERPVQQFLADNPNVLAAALLQGHTRVVKPQVRLGAEFVPDFVIGDASSIGIRWTLVELESPTAPMFITSGDYARKTREALHQIRSWRAWLGTNMGYARRLPPHGPGLLGIDAAAPGLVLVGRRGHRGETEPDAEWLRRSTVQREGIRVHTYDWLLELVEACAPGHTTARVRAQP